MTSPLRYPDLIGKAVIAVGDSEVLFEITGQLAANRMLIAVVGSDRDLVRRSVEAAEGLGAMVNGFTVDPSDPAVWERIRPHIEQRLGPIDVAICAGEAATRTVVRNALVPDMAARKRGVIIEVGADEARDILGDGVRHHAVDGDLPDAVVAALAVRHASDATAP